MDRDIITEKDVERERERRRNEWSDLDWALFFLDAAEMSLQVEYGAKTHPAVAAFLKEHQERIIELRRRYALGQEVANNLLDLTVEGNSRYWDNQG